MSAPSPTRLVEAGCDVVVGHHAHIIRRNRVPSRRSDLPWLGTAASCTRAESRSGVAGTSCVGSQTARKLFGSSPIPRYVLAPFHPEADTSG